MEPNSPTSPGLSALRRATMSIANMTKEQEKEQQILQILNNKAQNIFFKNKVNKNYFIELKYNDPHVESAFKELQDWNGDCSEE